MVGRGPPAASNGPNAPTPQVGQKIHGGGKVQATMKFLIREPLYDVMGVHVSASHALKLPGIEKFKRVQELHERHKFPSVSTGKADYVYNLISESHRIFVVGEKFLEAADHMEADVAQEMLDASLDQLNGGRGGRGPRSLRGGHAQEMRSCFPRETKVVLADGSLKSIEKVQPGDYLRQGGLVLGTMKLDGSLEPLYELPNGVVVSGSHAVRDPSDGVWRRAEFVEGAELIDRRDGVIYNLITENHRIIVAADRGFLEAADFLEVDEADELHGRNLAVMNDERW
uniref:Uncharacterized protein n=1 Tax=Phaeomonas parva TaxID=124430 RepID=A0A7S1TZM1_9STRA|mmetsp:Transcript_25066/g.78595  ORF Transcript_25066/g.78595 Transcript_25066/m.78595 type:complete len:284 (+) Transcript_25066:704-1555(+)